MFNFICRTFPHVRSFVKSSPSHKLFSLQYYHPLSSSSTAPKNIVTSSNKHSFTITYLVDTCGFLPNEALLVSNKINFTNAHRPDSVLAVLKKYGFTEAQISSVVKKFPQILKCNPEKNLLPKFEFLKSLGLSNPELARIIMPKPNILRRSLKNQIIPSFDFCKTLLQSHEQAVAAIKQSTVLLNDVRINLAPKIESLREVGVSESKIVFLLTKHASVFRSSTERFRKIGEEVKKLGINPSKTIFVLAVLALSVSKSKWEKKMELYKKWGLSENEIFIAFRKNPYFMIGSEDKITRVMDFLINIMGWEASVFARRPLLVSLSLSKRIAPRCAVYQVLLSKGFVKKDDSLGTWLSCSEMKFVDKIMKGYKNEAPELLKLHQEKLDLAN